MNIHSIQFKFLLIVISAILAIAVLVGGFSIYEVDCYIQQETGTLINTICANEASQVNDIFGDIEKSVRIMESYMLSLFDNIEDITNRERQKEILQLAGKMFEDVAVNTDGAVAYYLRFDPAISDGKTGMFYTKMNGSQGYICLEPTDILLYDKNDTEHVGWFWQPYEAGKPIWLAPYYNQNNGILMISYVIPLYCENQFVGIVGMDFDYTVLTERIREIEIYENGFAHLELDGEVVHTGYESADTDPLQKDSGEYMQVSKELANGMTLAIFASYKDIQQIRFEIAYKIVFSVIILAVVFSLIVSVVIKKIMKPLEKLTDASIKLSGGDYDVEIAQSDTYEIQQLSTVFENMIVNLREYQKLQHTLACRDSLTGLRNTTSYEERIRNVDKQIQQKDTSFGVVVFDINNLKETNDTYGHNAGNTLIVTASQIISDTFSGSSVFRIGGDEFVVILQDRNLEQYDRLLAEFDAVCANTFVETEDAKLSVSIAKGFSLFDPARDTQFLDVFNRADDEMYKDKKKMKKAYV